MDENEGPMEWINARSLHTPVLAPREPTVDIEVSHIVGKKIFTNDPRLLRLVNKWRRSSDPDKEDRFLRRSDKIGELKEALK